MTQSQSPDNYSVGWSLSDGVSVLNAAQRPTQWNAVGLSSKKSELSLILRRTPECGGEDVLAFGAEGQTQQRVVGSRLTKYQLLHSVLPHLTSGNFFSRWQSKPRPHRLFCLRLAFSGDDGKKSGADRNRLQLL